MKPDVRLCPIPRRAVALVLAVVVVATLGGGFAPSQAAAMQPAVAVSGAQATQLPGGQPQQGGNGGGVIDRVLVRVGDRAILYSDFEAQLQDRLGAIAAQIPQEQIDAQLPQIRMSLMVGLVSEAMLEMKADELGIAANANEVDRAINNIREQNGLLDDTQWRQALAQNGLTEAQLRETISGSIVQQRMIQQEISRNVFVSRREAQAYYDDNIEQFSEPEQVLYQQIIFVHQGNQREAVRERAENALAELRAGISLTAAGNKYAQTQNGDVVQDASDASWISPNDIRPEIAAAIAELTPLDYSEVVEGPFGFHIIQLMDRREGTTYPFEEVAGQIQNLLSEQKMGVEMNRYIGTLVETVSLEVYAEEFSDLRQALTEELQGAATGTPGQR